MMHKPLPGWGHGDFDCTVEVDTAQLTELWETGSFSEAFCQIWIVGIGTVGIWSVGIGNVRIGTCTLTPEACGQLGGQSHPQSPIRKNYKVGNKNLFYLQHSHCTTLWRVVETRDSSLVQRVICPKRICIGLVLRLGLASNFGICTISFRTNDHSDKWPFYW